MKHLVITAAIYAATASPVLADVKAASETGFNVIHIATVQATPDEIWKRLVAPKDYWNKSHSWSGSTAGSRSPTSPGRSPMPPPCRRPPRA